MNRIEIVGNLTRPQDIRATHNSQVTKRAIGERGRTRDKGQFTDLEAWGSMADSLASYPTGAWVRIGGWLKHDTYQDRDGAKRRSTYVVVQEIAVVQLAAPAYVDEAAIAV